jgi:C-terminal processing protease CtpA/Prc
MRFNGGGNSGQGTEFISKLSGYNISKQDKKIYVVIGRQTFSSAIINTMDFKGQTKAILVGEETGGKPNHFGEVRNLQLPSSGLNISYSTKYFTRTKEDLKTIRPDVIIESSFSDFKKGIDPVYEWIKKQ